MLRKFRLRKLVFFVFLCLFSIVVMASSATAKTKRDKQPQCQEGCLAKHSARMELLSEEYTKIGDKVKYQDTAEDEASSYF
jgi:hypothetical protein